MTKINTIKANMQNRLLPANDPVGPAETFNHSPLRKLNPVELMSIHTLVKYAAANSNLLESTVTDRLCALCDAMNMEDIAASQYDTAVVFLVDFNSRVH